MLRDFPPQFRTYRFDASPTGDAKGSPWLNAIRQANRERPDGEDAPFGTPVDEFEDPQSGHWYEIYTNAIVQLDPIDKPERKCLIYALTEVLDERFHQMWADQADVTEKEAE